MQNKYVFYFSAKFIILENKYHIFLYEKCIIHCFALRKISIGPFNIFGFFWITIITARFTFSLFRSYFLILGTNRQSTNQTYVTHQSLSFKLTPYFSCNCVKKENMKECVWGSILSL